MVQVQTQCIPTQDYMSDYMHLLVIYLVLTDDSSMNLPPKAGRFKSMTLNRLPGI